MSYDEILFSVADGVAVVTLNRPRALNALTLDKIRHLDPALRVWADDSDVRLVIIEGTGERAFCAGGDVRAMAQAAGQGRFADNETFFAEEYRLNRLIKTYPKPFVALIDGITMGGGVGVSVHGRFRVATERTQVAMPETGIGMLPDVGGTWILPRCPGEVGTWMALTGARQGAADALAAGLATHYVPSERLPELKAALCAPGADPEAVLARFHADPGPASWPARQALIDRCFAGDDAETILEALAAEGDPWAAEARATVLTKSPLSTRVTLRALREGATLDFDGCLRQEYRLASRLTRLPDFAEGVRAVLIDKDNQPRWSPATLDGVDPDAVEALFAPGPEPDLNLGPRL
ncbi:enoyl-CoA hydratase/isomerase family protein [Pararhodospirillum oryzae]|uniref:Enoyl-CoA hydratase n=1 Tax=Pararhodospirillum oryzae TaxID=478448 RepID=A0A512H5E9_9PROT|nr:enoyl-CoA hydratase/isomerase family protein [Pararhodospirillum oryzae]GEO80600.1 enoyl-CoA hydratase [Pararhodospirillum oryzae]